MVRTPSSLLMVAVKFVAGAPPQNVVLVTHVHLRFWHSHVEGLESVIDCRHESAVQKNCSTPSYQSCAAMVLDVGREVRLGIGESAGLRVRMMFRVEARG